jgi:hypothetical protein
MPSSLASLRTNDAVLRLTRWILPAILACSLATGCGPQAPQTGPVPPGPIGSIGPQAPQGSPQGPQGPQSSLVGQWRTTLQSGTLTISIAANGQYMQQGTTTTGVQTMQSGPYQLAAPNTIHFTVTNWSPKTKWMYVPNPRCGVPGVPNPTNPQRDSCRTEQEWTEPQPPGSTYAYVFNGPNSMTLNNETAQETITFTRAMGQ